MDGMVSMTPDLDDATEVWKRRHHEWVEFREQWQWLYDSWEGGERYRQATYGRDNRGQFCYNLVRHKREYPDSVTLSSTAVGLPNPLGTDSTYQATSDDFELRRARTPVPQFLEEAIEQHLAKIFEQEITRDAKGNATLKAWWEDVDGRGTSIDDYMADTIGPMVLALGCLDVMIDRPMAPEGVQVRSRADEAMLGLDKAVASYILPQNMVWWELEPSGRYEECLILECCDGDDCLRHWTAEDWTLYSADGKVIEGPTPHGYGRVPIMRIFDRRLPRCENVGKARYRQVAELQREFYNRDSELILDDTTMSHPIVQAPGDVMTDGATITIGPNYTLPKVKSGSGGDVHYENWEVLEFPKGAADSLRTNKTDIRNEVDRAARLSKPAGAAGTGAATVAQSGISKQLDQTEGNALLTRVAKTLCRVEFAFAELVLLVVDGVEPGDPSFEITYPMAFSLATPKELADLLVMFQDLISNAGSAPETEARVLNQLIQHMLPGLKDDEYATLYQEVEDHLAEKVKQDQQEAEMKASAGMLSDGTQLPATPDAGGSTGPKITTSVNV